MVDLLLTILGSSLTGSTGLVLPDRASSDLSREAGLKDMTLLCTGVPAERVVSNTFMASFNGTVVKGNSVKLVRNPRGRRMVVLAPP